MNIVHGLFRPLQGWVSIDTEFFGMQKKRLHRPEGRFASLQICNGDTVYVITEEREIEQAIYNIMDCEYWVLHNALFDLRQLSCYTDISNHPKIWDTMLMEKALYGGYYDTFGLKDLVRRYLDVKLDKSIRDEFTDGEGEFTPEMLQYAAEDAYWTLRVAEIQSKQECPAYWNYDEPMIDVVLAFQPIKIDVAGWELLVSGFEAKGAEIEKELGVNVFSPKQVKEFLHAHGIKVNSTGADVLGELEDNPLVDEILRARMYRKANSTYGMSWIENFVEKGDLVYPSFSITGAETGRMSCSDPNVMQLPSRKIPEYRKLIISKRGKIIKADQSQQEPRLLACLAKDKALINAFLAEEDIHLTVTRAVFHDQTIEKSDPRRAIGKAINLGTSYGLTAAGLARKTGNTEQEAQAILDGYFNRFGGVKAYIQNYRDSAYRNGYVETIGKRRVWMNLYTYQWENNAINAPIQGSAADFTKRWMRLIWEACEFDGIEFPIMMPVHDEVVCDVPEDMVEEYTYIIQDASTQTAKEMIGDTIPFVAEVKVGDTWGG